MSKTSRRGPNVPRKPSNGNSSVPHLSPFPIPFIYPRISTLTLYQYEISDPHTPTDFIFTSTWCGFKSAAEGAGFSTSSSFLGPVRRSATDAPVVGGSDGIFLREGDLKGRGDEGGWEVECVKRLLTAEV